jgi:hypothetical protein
MIPVDQTRFGVPRGNCLAASAASILEIPLEVAEAHGELRTGPDQWADLCKLAHRYGYDLEFVQNRATPWRRPRGYQIGAGVSPRGRNHACVFLDGELVHDPHPSGGGLLTVDRWYLFRPRE